MTNTSKIIATSDTKQILNENSTIEVIDFTCAEFNANEENL